VMPGTAAALAPAVIMTASMATQSNTVILFML